MSTSISITAYSGKNSPEFQKHFNAVKFCIENELSYPKETSEFFKGKVCGDDLEDIVTKAVLECIEDGIEIPLITSLKQNGEIRIAVADIPKEVDEIIVKLS